MSSCSARCAPTSTRSRPRQADDARSIEHRGDLIDIDAFLGDAEVVIGDDHGDGVEGAPDAVPDQLADRRQNLAADRGEARRDNAAADQAEDGQHGQQPEHLPAMSFGELGTASHALQRPELLDHAGRRGHEPAREEHESREDQENGSEHPENRHQQRKPDDRKKPPQPDLQGLGQIDAPTTHFLECAVEHDGLAQRAEHDHQHHADQKQDQPLHDGLAGGAFGERARVARQQQARQMRHRGDDKEGEEIARQHRGRPIENTADPEIAFSEAPGEGGVGHMSPCRNRLFGKSRLVLVAGD